MVKLREPVPAGSRAAVQMAVVDSGDSGASDGGGGRQGGSAPDHGGGGGSVAVALLLAAAAVAAAIIGTRTSMLSSDASDAWQSALRTEEKRSAAAMNDIRQLYQVEVPMAVRALQAGLTAEEMQTAAAEADPVVRQALQVEAAVQEQMRQLLSGQSDLTTDPEYALPAGGFDLGRRLADNRAASPDLLSLDPDAIQKEGDRLADEALLLTYSLLPVSLAALLGVLAQPLRRRRAILLGSSAAFLAAGSIMALGVEVLA